MLNLELMKQPANWITVILMVIIGTLVFRFVLSPFTDTTQNPA